MKELAYRIRKLLNEDRRYKPEAYHFVQEALGYAQNVMKLGTEAETEMDDESEADETEEKPVRRDSHLTGQQLCEAIREYALEQFGLMSKVVLNRWGLKTTGDIGEIVYNLISIGCMKKSPSDRREDFDDVYDFDVAFRQQFRMDTEGT